MTASELIDRARSAIGHKIPYALSKGGYHPEQPLPGGPGGCDCSGFIAWVLGRSRCPQPDFPRWLSTDSIHADAMGSHVLFTRVLQVVPGTLAVYPDHRGPDGVTRQGHVALVVDPAARTIIDCSGSHNGITERVDDKAHFFTRPDAIFCVYTGKRG